jgi:outer membrane protein TolC
MTRQHSLLAGLVAATLAVAVGCRPQDPFYFTQRNEVPGPYRDTALDIEYPDVDQQSLDEVEHAKPPLSLDNPKPEKSWDLSLEKSVQIALANSTVIRNLGGVVFGPAGAQGVPSAILQSPQLTPTIYLPALEESNPRSGAEAALSAFDAQLAATLAWERLDSPQNVNDVPDFFNSVRQADTATGRIQISKTAATGDQFAISHNVYYELGNSPRQIWPSAWTPSIQADFRHPFLQGSGLDFNRIAGPGAQPGIFNGVLLARIRVDQSLADFEGAVRNMTADVERAYWNLYFVYRRLQIAIDGRNASLRTWQTIRAKAEAGAPGGTAQDEAQARQQYFIFLAEVQRTQANLYKSERSLRYMLGLTVSDGRLIYPSDEPTTAKIQIAWDDLMPEALTRSVELRKHKWRIKQAELELVAAKNFLLPRLDGVAWYRFVGLGENLLDYPRAQDAQGHYNSGYGSLADGAFQEWHLGLEFRMPFGFRKEMAGVRNAQINVTLQKRILQEQELELSHQMADAWADLSQNYELSQTRYNQLSAAAIELRSFETIFSVGAQPSGGEIVNLLLDAQRRRAEAETQYYQSLVDYSLSLMTIHLRKGSLLELHGVVLAEGPWPTKAYFDARRRARARNAAHYIDYGITRPNAVSRGPVEQMVQGGPIVEGKAGASALKPTPSAGVDATESTLPEPAEPVETAPELIPAPKSSTGKKPAAEAPSPAAGSNPQSRALAPGAEPTQNAASGRKPFDLGSMDLSGLARESSVGTRTASPASEVRPTSHTQGGPAIGPASGNAPREGWKAATPSGVRHEANPIPPTPATAPAAAEWKSVQHGGDGR